MHWALSYHLYSLWCPMKTQNVWTPVPRYTWSLQPHWVTPSEHMSTIIPWSSVRTLTNTSTECMSTAARFSISGEHQDQVGEHQTQFFLIRQSDSQSKSICISLELLTSSDAQNPKISMNQKQTKKNPRWFMWTFKYNNQISIVYLDSFLSHAVQKYLNTFCFKIWTPFAIFSWSTFQNLTS